MCFEQRPFNNDEACATQNLTIALQRCISCGVLHACTTHQACTLVTKRYWAKDTAHTTRQGCTPVNKRQVDKDTAHAAHRACSLVNKSEDAKDGAQTTHQASTPVIKRHEAKGTRHKPHQACALVKKPQEAKDTAHTTQQACRSFHILRYSFRHGPKTTNDTVINTLLTDSCEPNLLQHMTASSANFLGYYCHNIPNVNPCLLN